MNTRSRKEKTAENQKYAIGATATKPKGGKEGTAKRIQKQNKPANDDHIKVETIEKEKNRIIRYALRIFENKEKAEALRTALYSTDFKAASVSEFIERLRVVSGFLLSVEQVDGNKYKHVVDEVVHLVGKRVENSNDAIIDAIRRNRDRMKIRFGETVEIIDPIHPKLFAAVITAKRKSITRRKMNAIIHRDVAFNEADFKDVAREFDVPIDDAKELISMLKSCFDTDGRFLRDVFERHIPFFAWYEKKIFDFMWHYLKETQDRTDRVAFLNALQLLIIKMKEPKKNAIKSLLTDFLQYPQSVSFSDRNALVLSNLLVRKYNKELNLDIEVTPEEVLLVKEGVDKKLTAAIAESIDTVYKKRFQKKVRTVHGRVIDSLRSERKNTKALPFHFMLSLERELFIFLSLIGGHVGKTVMRGMVKKYGNPNSEVYRSKKSREYLVNLLQHLKLGIRGLSRKGDTEDLQILTGVSNQENSFLKLAQTEEQSDKLKQVIRWIDLSRESIVENDMHDTRDSGGFTVLR